MGPGSRVTPTASCCSAHRTTATRRACVPDRQRHKDRDGQALGVDAQPALHAARSAAQRRNPNLSAVKNSARTLGFSVVTAGGDS
jgi:hypothetical protein